MTTVALIPGLGTVGPTELIILLTIILLLFGAKRIPELAKGLGSGVREFKRGTSGEAEKEDKELSRGEAARNGEARAEDDNAEQEHQEPTDESQPSQAAVPLAKRGRTDA